MPTFVYIDPAGAAQTVTVDYVASYVSTTAGAAHSFSSCSIGTAATGRVVVACIAADNGVNTCALSSGTINASAASVDVTTNIKNGTAAVMSLALDSGTSADITATLSVSVSSCSVHIFAVYGAASTTPSATTSATGSTPPSITIPAGGVCVGVGNANAQGLTWTVTGVSEDADADYGPTSAYCVGSVESLLGGSTSVQFLPSGSPAKRQAFAAWG